MILSFHSNRRTRRLRLLFTNGADCLGVHPTQQEMLTKRCVGLFTEITKKAFKRLRATAPVSSCAHRQNLNEALTAVVTDVNVIAAIGCTTSMVQDQRRMMW
jgi:hypothetical protein